MGIIRHSSKPVVIVFKPVEARLTIENHKANNIDAYCEIRVGIHNGITGIDYDSGKNPSWYDAVFVERNHAAEVCENRNQK